VVDLTGDAPFDLESFVGVVRDEGNAFEAVSGL